MDAKELLRQQFRESNEWLAATMQGVTSEQAHWKPPGTANPLGATYAHALLSQDIIGNVVIKGGAPLCATTWAGKAGISESPPTEDVAAWGQWARQVKVDLDALRAYGQAVQTAADGVIMSLTDADLDRVSFSKEQLPDALSLLKEQVEEVVILATCNRTEIYSATQDPVRTGEMIRSFLAKIHGIAADDITPYLYEYTDDAAVRHLFEVASGMDSLVLGEPQILGQVRDSFTEAVQARSAKRDLSKLFHHALRAGKKARKETAIGRHAMSVSYVCVELVRETLGELRESTALLVGVGEAGKLACRALAKAGVGQITVVNRTYHRARSLADELGGIALPFDRLVEALAEADIVISATGASTHVISAAAVRQAAREHNGNPLLLMDIAMPRDIDPLVADIPGVSLFDIDDLQAVSASNRKEREGEVVKVEAIIEEALAGFSEARGSSEVDSTLAALYRQAEELRRREVAKTLNLLPEITEKQRNDIETMSRSLIRKLLHNPMAALRGQGGAEDCEAFTRLFNLDTVDDPK